MRLIMTLLASSILLIGCGAKEEGGKQDLSGLRSQCMEQSGFTGNANFYPGGVFVWRADDAEVAECEWDGNNVKFIGILGSGTHPSDA